MISFLFSISLSFGGSLGFFDFSCFNKHLLFLEKRAEENGWYGKFENFKEFMICPELELYPREDIFYYVSTGFYFNEAQGIFTRKEEKIKEEWRFLMLPFYIGIYSSLKEFSLKTGFDIWVSWLRVKINDSTMRFVSKDISIRIGILKRFKKIGIEVFLRGGEISGFSANGKFLWYHEDLGYIYHGDELLYSSRAFIGVEQIGIAVRYLF